MKNVSQKTKPSSSNTTGKASSGPEGLAVEQPGYGQAALPEGLSAGVEALSGFSMGDVRVHYNSSKPAQLKALAYAQGADIHLGPGQERHLPHEAWHVVQQKQGRVKPGIQSKGVSINTDSVLEEEADAMGQKAQETTTPKNARNMAPVSGSSGSVVQGMFIIDTKSEDFPEGQEFTEYDELTDFIYHYTGIRMVPSWRLKRLEDHNNIGIPISEKDELILDKALDFIRQLQSSKEIRFSSPDELERVILYYYTALVEESQTPIRTNQAGIIVDTDPDEWPGGQQFEDYNELAEFLLNHTGLELVPFGKEYRSEGEERSTFRNKRRRYATLIDTSSHLTLLMKMLNSETGFYFFSPDALARKIARDFPQLVKSFHDTPESSFSEQQSSSSGETPSPLKLRPFSSLLEDINTKTEQSPEEILNAELDDVYRLVIHEDTKLPAKETEEEDEYGGSTSLPPFGWMTNILHTDADFRKQLAADLFIKWFLYNGGELWGNIIMKKLQVIKWVCALDSADFETYHDAPAVAFRASPAVYVPLAVAGSKLSGAKSGAKTGKQYLKPVRYDTKLASPAGEFIEQFNKLIAGEEYDPTGAPKEEIGELKTTQKNNGTLLKSKPADKYNRPGKVEALITESKPGTGRTGSGETEIGWFGGDEEQLNTGQQTIPYEGGHLIGDQIMEGVNLFDMYEDWNLAPQAKSFNNPLYITAMENAAVNAISNGAELHYKVTVKYPSDTYTLKPSEVIPNAVDPNAEMKPKSKKNAKKSAKKKKNETFVSAFQKLLKNDPTIDNKLFTFHSRVPNYWHARMEDTTGTNVIEGKGRDDPRGPISSTTIQESEDYQPTGSEQFKYQLIVDSKALALAPKKKEVAYQKANKVKLKARQQAFVASTGKSLKTLSLTEINDIIKNKNRSSLIHDYVQKNVLNALSDLQNISGVGPKTIDLLKAANISI